MSRDKGTITPETLLTTAVVARLLQCNVTTVINWVKKGYLSTYRTPGGHRRISAAEVARFLVKQGLPLPESLAGVAK